MTSDHDARTRTVVSWLREDAHENAERVLLAALNDIDHTQQRRSWWPARRFPAMNTFAKAFVATAAVVAVAVGGINLLPGSQTGAGGPPPSTSPSTPPPSPSPFAESDPGADGKPGGRSDAGSHPGRRDHAAGHLRHSPVAGAE